MRYISTRGKAPALTFDDVLLTGLAEDGGLYLPETWPQLDAATLESMVGQPYAHVAARVMQPYIAGSTVEARFASLVAEAYAGFGHPAVVPLRQLDAGLWMLELFYGPTLAFKDVALQLLARLFDAVLEARGERLTILAATSGDTGSAAIEACRGSERIDIFVLHPAGRTSEVQRRQMTTVQAPNVHNIAIEGTFDDCQDLVKSLFSDQELRRKLRLSAVNSINWARIMAQIVYYVVAAIALGAPQRQVSFTVPTGNFGNVFAGYAARAMGLPIKRLLVASNSNDILARFFESGSMSIESVSPTLSPSMDIQVSSNFERLLFDLLGQDGAGVSETMTSFRRDGCFRLTAEQLAAARSIFDGFRLDDTGTLAEIAHWHHSGGELVDPHTAVGLAAARRRRDEGPVPMVSLATAHPGKFPDAVARATGERPQLPPRLADLFARPESFTRLAPDEAALKALLRKRARLAGAPA